MSDYRQHVEALRACVSDPTRILAGEQIDEIYSHDELGDVRVMPSLVAKATSTQEVSAILAYAYAHEIPVTPRGAGTGLVGAAVPVLGGLVLDLSLMNRILELDEENMTVTVEPGVLLMTLGEYVTAHGLFYPPDPGEKTATIGGNISTNAGGMRAVKYGVTRDYVRSLEVVLPDGRVMELGGKVAKCSSGYSLKDLMIGAEGTLGVITRAVLRLLPLPTHTVSLLVPYDTLEQAIATVPFLTRAQAVPTAIEFMQRDVILAAEEYLGARFPDRSADAYLLLRLDGGTDEQIRVATDEAAGICLSHGARDVFLVDTEERSDSVWKPRGAFLEAIKGSATALDEVDVVVPRACIYPMVEELGRIERELSVRIRYFGHAGDGNLHIYVLRDGQDDALWQKTLQEAMEQMYRKAHQLGGKESGEHGSGYVKQPYLHESPGADQLALMAGIKAVFDPKGLLNPRKIFALSSLDD